MFTLSNQNHQLHLNPTVYLLFFVQIIDTIIYFSDPYIANPQLKYFQYQKTNNTVNLQHERDGLRSDLRDKWHQKQNTDHKQSL